MTCTGCGRDCADCQCGAPAWKETAAERQRRLAAERRDRREWDAHEMDRPTDARFTRSR